MAVVKTRGIIIRRFDLGEADKILTIITEDRGKIRVIAKGISKPQAKMSGFLEMFRYNEYLLAEGRNLDIVTGAHTIDNLQNISKSLERIALAYYIAEIVDRLIEETQETERMFELIYSILKEVNRGKISLDLLKSFFEINILVRLGFKPELDHCVECGEPILKEGWFSYILGGILDRQHQISDPLATELNFNELDALRGLIAGDIKNIVDSHGLYHLAPKVTQVCSGFLDHIVDRSLRSKEFLNKVADFS